MEHPAAPQTERTRAATPSEPFDESRYVAQLRRQLAAERERLLALAGAAPEAPDSSRVLDESVGDLIGTALILIRHALLVERCEAPVARRAVAAQASTCLGLERAALDSALDLRDRRAALSGAARAGVLSSLAAQLDSVARRLGPIESAGSQAHTARSTIPRPDPAS